MVCGASSLKLPTWTSDRMLHGLQPPPCMPRKTDIMWCVHAVYAISGWHVRRPVLHSGPDPIHSLPCMLTTTYSCASCHTPSTNAKLPGHRRTNAASTPRQAACSSMLVIPPPAVLPPPTHFSLIPAWGALPPPPPPPRRPPLPRLPRPASGVSVAPTSPCWAPACSGRPCHSAPPSATQRAGPSPSAGTAEGRGDRGSQVAATHMCRCSKQGWSMQGLRQHTTP